jgi:hypothetical protein
VGLHGGLFVGGPPFCKANPRKGDRLTVGGSTRKEHPHRGRRRSGEARPARGADRRAAPVATRALGLWTDGLGETRY